MSTFFSEIAKTLKNEIERFRNRDFLKATMAASAFLALADGKVTISEQLARDYILENIRELKLYDVHKADDMFRYYVEAIQSNPEAEEAEILRMASKFSEDKDHAVMLVRASILIAKADSTLSKREKEVIGKICRVLNLNTSEAICINPSA